MGREYTVIAALAATDVPVPRVDAFCDDVEVNGAPFYVMERVDGRILRTEADMADLTPDDARRCSHELIDVLARLHAVDYEAVGLGEFGRPDGFLARNVARWGKQWQANKTRELPQIDELARRLERALPESGPAGDRARRLPARQHDARPGRSRARRRRARLGDVDARRSAHRPRPLPRVLGWRQRPRGRVERRHLGGRRLRVEGRDRRPVRRAVRAARSSTSTSTSCSRPTSSR